MRLTTFESTTNFRKDPEFERLGLNRTRNQTLDLFMNQLEDRNLSPMQDTPPGLSGAGYLNNRERGIVTYDVNIGFILTCDCLRFNVFMVDNEQNLEFD
jgi:hypothetical protein